MRNMCVVIAVHFVALSLRMPFLVDWNRPFLRLNCNRMALNQTSLETVMRGERPWLLLLFMLLQEVVLGRGDKWGAFFRQDPQNMFLVGGAGRLQISCAVLTTQHFNVRKHLRLHTSCLLFADCG